MVVDAAARRKKGKPTKDRRRGTLDGPNDVFRLFLDQVDSYFVSRTQKEARHYRLQKQLREAFMLVAQELSDPAEAQPAAEAEAVPPQPIVDADSGSENIPGGSRPSRVVFTPATLSNSGAAGGAVPSLVVPRKSSVGKSGSQGAVQRPVTVTSMAQALPPPRERPPLETVPPHLYLLPEHIDMLLHRCNLNPSPLQIQLLHRLLIVSAELDQDGAAGREGTSGQSPPRKPSSRSASKTKGPKKGSKTAKGKGAVGAKSTAVVPLSAPTADGTSPAAEATEPPQPSVQPAAIQLRRSLSKFPFERVQEVLLPVLETQLIRYAPEQILEREEELQRAKERVAAHRGPDRMEPVEDPPTADSVLGSLDTKHSFAAVGLVGKKSKGKAKGRKCLRTKPAGPVKMLESYVCARGEGDLQCCFNTLYAAQQQQWGGAAAEPSAPNSIFEKPDGAGKRTCGATAYSQRPHRPRGLRLGWLRSLLSTPLGQEFAALTRAGGRDPAQRSHDGWTGTADGNGETPNPLQWLQQGSDAATEPWLTDGELDDYFTAAMDASNGTSDDDSETHSSSSGGGANGGRRDAGGGRSPSVEATFAATAANVPAEVISEDVFLTLAAE